MCRCRQAKYELANTKHEHAECSHGVSDIFHVDLRFGSVDVSAVFFGS